MLKKLLGLSAVMALFSTMLLAGTWSGILIDKNCSTKKDLAEHTRKCAIHCADSGYGLVTADGKFVKFDKTGDQKALALLKASKKVNDLKATVTGTLEGDTLKVETVTLD